ncbi:hypothetical protein ACH4S8_09795 [Streptomyces sp. NPDC021080]|uniref:hypothetical protein n=1 Tax=Streptomyces sp. NPDC021080 TaxID=3365110 RepID=UPI00378F5C04
MPKNDGADGGTRDPSSSSRRLEDVINAYYRGDRPPHNEIGEISEEIHGTTGSTSSVTRLRELATVRKRDVSRDQLRFLARHFGVTPDQPRRHGDAGAFRRAGARGWGSG